MKKGNKPRDKRDIYYRKAKEEGWRARSAFKLLQIDEEFQILKDVKKAVDLCAAPGSWSQVLRRRMGEDSKIVAVDLQKMAPLEGVIQLQGDITSQQTANEIIRHFSGEKADLVVCDGAPDVTGMHDLDEYIQSQLLLAALNITTHILKENGTFVAKIFRGKDVTLLYAKFGIFFRKMNVTKPRSSRNSSIESFIVCREFHIPNDYKPSMERIILSEEYDDESKSASTNQKEKEENEKDGKILMKKKKNELLGENRYIIPFISCGDLSGFDSDVNYEIKGDSKVVLQQPIDAPYEDQIIMKKNKYKNIRKI